MLNQTTPTVLPNEQIEKITNEVAHIKEQWNALIEGFNQLKQRLV